ncbi:MAG: hypothetical protein ACTHK2_04565 [Dokdonella sp.]|uniref:hypothetical protein n=1 Tax=Dokdonella sp. TaxID=2291710 RepID=UPI003F7E1C56
MIPAGYKLVPIEPDEAMVDALENQLEYAHFIAGARAALAAAIAAAPEAPTAQTSASDGGAVDHGKTIKHLQDCLAAKNEEIRTLRAMISADCGAPAAPVGDAELPPCRDPRMDKFNRADPLPGMISAFETHFGQSWTDGDWRSEASTWAAAWAACRAAQALVRKPGGEVARKPLTEEMAHALVNLVQTRMNSWENFQKPPMARPDPLIELVREVERYHDIGGTNICAGCGKREALGIRRFCVECRNKPPEGSAP